MVGGRFAILYTIKLVNYISVLFQIQAKASFGLQIGDASRSVQNRNNRDFSILIKVELRGHTSL